jgi:hypothetical protein
VNSGFEPGVLRRQVSSTSASASLIRLAIGLQFELDVEGLARAVMSLCVIVERQQKLIESLEAQCTDAGLDLRRACARGQIRG